MSQQLSHNTKKFSAKNSMEVVGVDQLIREHEPAFRKLRNDLGFDDEEFNHLRLLLEEYITWVHGLPASETFYADRGGLLQQGLDGAFWAGRGSRSQVFDSYDLTPREKHENKPRWLMASVVGGLLYGTEDALQRLVVTDSQNQCWDYRSISLTNWLAQKGIRCFFYAWRDTPVSSRRVLVDQLLPRPLLKALGRPITSILRRVLHGEAIEPLASLLKTVYQENCRQLEVRTVPAEEAQEVRKDYSPSLNQPVGFDIVYLHAQLQQSDPSPPLLNRWLQLWLTQSVSLQPVPGVPVVCIRCWRWWLGLLPKPIPMKVMLRYILLDQLPLMSASDWQMKPNMTESFGVSTTLTQIQPTIWLRKMDLEPNCTWKVFFYDRRIYRHRQRLSVRLKKKKLSSSYLKSVTYRLELGEHLNPLIHSVERVHWLSEDQMEDFRKNCWQQRQVRRKSLATTESSESDPDSNVSKITPETVIEPLSQQGTAEPITTFQSESKGFLK